ncbi:MAG: recombinase RecA [Phycisphaeraceae bacterium]|nr:recombinase RecA [Phycisphaeraceae bacterium]
MVSNSTNASPSSRSPQPASGVVKSPAGSDARTASSPEGRTGTTRGPVASDRSVGPASQRSVQEAPVSQSKSVEPKSVEPKPGDRASGGAGAPAGNSKSTTGPGAAAAAPDTKGKWKALEAAMSQIEKSYGKGSIMRLDGEKIPEIPAISTGALSLDLALGGRGLPRGRVIEIFGPESSGKTTLALTVIAHAQKAGGVAAFIDAEHALDPSWAKRLGVNLDEMLVSQPDTGEQALEICEMLVRSNAVDVVVVDSVAALIPRAEIEGEMGDSHVGLQARLMSQALRKLTGAIAKSETIVIFINQLREKIGVMFGSPETTTGGRALKFYASVRVDIRRIGSIKDGERNVGNRVRAKVVKNKIAPPFREAEFDIMFDEGISTAGDVLDLAVADGVVDKSGSWFSFSGTRLGQGREGAKGFLRENPETMAQIRNEVMRRRLANPAGSGRRANDDE